MDKIKPVELYRNIFEEGKEKGSFGISREGLLMPRTRNVSLWGLASSHIIPKQFRQDPHIVTSIKEELEHTPPTQLPAFFKFQKEPFSIFAEAVAMQVATHFNTRTSFNYPAVIDTSEGSLYEGISPLLKEQQSNYGSIVFSFLGDNEELVSFYKMNNLMDISYDVMTMCSNIPQFLRETFPEMQGDKLSEMSGEIQRDFAYQYLLRDYLGDIDFTSRNSGIVINRTAGYAHLAPNFDYGEVMNILLATKIKEPTLLDPAIVGAYMSQELIDKTNASKLEKFNAPASQVAQEDTFDKDKTTINIDFICREFPEVAGRFIQDLTAFSQSGELPRIIAQYAGEDNLVTEEQSNMCIEYLQTKGDILAERLTENLMRRHPEYQIPVGTQQDNNEYVETSHCPIGNDQEMFNLETTGNPYIEQAAPVNLPNEQDGFVQ